MFALAMQDPIPIVKYAYKKQIMSQYPFHNLIKFCNGDSPNQMAKIFKAKTNPGTTKIKFGVKVPMSIRQAYELDKQNKNNEWEEAIKKELKQLSEYGTCLLYTSPSPRDGATSRMPSSA